MLRTQTAAPVVLPSAQARRIVPILIAHADDLRRHAAGCRHTATRAHTTAAAEYAARVARYLTTPTEAPGGIEAIILSPGDASRIVSLLSVAALRCHARARRATDGAALIATARAAEAAADALCRGLRDHRPEAGR